MESTLAITFAELKQAVGYWLGITTDESSWSAAELSEVKGDVDAGCLLVYRSYPWRFMKPVLTLQTTADQGDYDLPDDFGGFHGRLTYAPDEGHAPISLVDESQIRASRQIRTSTGKPCFAAYRIKGPSDAVSGQRYVLLLDPTPDSTYLLTGQYVAIPAKCDGDRPYPLGGALHGALFRAACLAESERRIRGGYGPLKQAFDTELANSIGLDAAQAPEKLGYNADWSDGREVREYRSRGQVFTYQGVQY